MGIDLKGMSVEELNGLMDDISENLEARSHECQRELLPEVMKLLNGSEWALYSYFACGYWSYNLYNTDGEPKHGNGEYINNKFEDELWRIVGDHTYYLSDKSYVRSHDGAVSIYTKDQCTIEDVVLLVKTYGLLLNVDSHDYDIVRCKKNLASLNHGRLHSLSVLAAERRSNV